MATGARVGVSGLKELHRDLLKMADQIDDDLRDGLREAADPVKEAAQSKALSEITNMPPTPDWAEMRIGVTRAAATVYMVPAHRRSRGSGRSNLANLLMERAMDPALEEKAGEVEEGVGRIFDKLAGHNGF